MTWAEQYQGAQGGRGQKLLRPDQRQLEFLKEKIVDVNQGDLKTK